MWKECWLDLFASSTTDTTRVPAVMWLEFRAAQSAGN
jgi:hypothetical protein